MKVDTLLFITRKTLKHPQLLVHIVEASVQKLGILSTHIILIRDNLHICLLRHTRLEEVYWSRNDIANVHSNDNMTFDTLSFCLITPMPQNVIAFVAFVLYLKRLRRLALFTVHS